MWDRALKLRDDYPDHATILKAAPTQISMQDSRCPYLSSLGNLILQLNAQLRISSSFTTFEYN